MSEFRDRINSNKKAETAIRSENSEKSLYEIRTVNRFIISAASTAIYKNVTGKKAFSLTLTTIMATVAAIIMIITAVTAANLITLIFQIDPWQAYKIKHLSQIKRGYRIRVTDGRIKAPDKLSDK